MHPRTTLFQPSPRYISAAEGPEPLSLRTGGVASGGAVLDTFGRLFCNGRLRHFPLYTDRVVRRVVAPASAELRLLPRGRVRTGMWGPTPATHEGAYP